MSPHKKSMSVLAQIMRWIPDRIIKNDAIKLNIKHRSFSTTSHVVTIILSHLSQALSLNDICDSLSNHACILAQIRNCTPLDRSGLSYANKTRSADLIENLFWKMYEILAKQFPDFLKTNRDYPARPYRFRKRTIRAVDSTTIHLVANCMGCAKHRCRKTTGKVHVALKMQSFCRT